jgi:hypothetical protein
LGLPAGGGQRVGVVHRAHGQPDQARGGAGDRDQRPDLVERVDGVLRLGVAEDGDQGGNAEHGADLAEGGGDGAAGGQARAGQIDDGGAAQRGDRQPDTGTHQQHRG